MTSTPNDHIRDLCKKYNIPMYINEGKSGITQDWNYAYSRADAELVTITHQDDIYRRNYTEKLFEYIDMAQNPTYHDSDSDFTYCGDLLSNDITLMAGGLSKKAFMTDYKYICIDRSLVEGNRVYLEDSYKEVLWESDLFEIRKNN